jgi:hypothetical protein
LYEAVTGRRFRLQFGALNQASFRLRLPLSAVDQNAWMLDREGAYLKPLVGGDRVDLAKVDRVVLVVANKSEEPLRWCMTPLRAAASVDRLEKPVLPNGPLLDQFGQSTLHSWPGKTRDETELKTRLSAQAERAAKTAWPEGWSRWGGWKERKLAEGSGFFRTLQDQGRWWLVDPDGYAFWSTGPDCVLVDAEARYDGLESALQWAPPADGDYAPIYEASFGSGGQQKTVNYLAANLIRAFGASRWRDKWAAIALSEMKQLGFNTVGNWSDWKVAARASFPYVRPLSFRPRRSRTIYRDFPDVFHPGFEQDAAEYAAALETTKSDPALVGYFLMNEPTWGFSSELPAQGMLYTTQECHSRSELGRFLREKYRTAEALQSAWHMSDITFEQVERGVWSRMLTADATADLRAFSTKLSDRYFSVLSSACRKVDPKHLNLGMRWAGVPPTWAAEGMRHFDVFSLNCYQEKLPRDVAEKIHALLGMPVLVGEWHFGALDVGLPASGLQRVADQEARGAAYRYYLDDAAANPFCVGAHWFTLYDQSALGRFDGENYNIGFYDVCNRPYPEIAEAARKSHKTLYEVASGTVHPFRLGPKYLPRVTL